ncbi:MAG: ABC transporter permease [Planctomycetota bacterium]|nr:ABC transporter permease [Planctomycetota bacterium]
MTGATLVQRSLRFYWRTHLGVALGAAVSVAVLVGALAVGDSVPYTLKRLALGRLGETDLALAAPGRDFRAALADGLAGRLGARVAPVLALRGSASRGQGDARVDLNRVQVLGVEDAFWSLAGPDAAPPCAEGEVILNERAARGLGVGVGDMIRLRVEKPSALARDAPLSTDADASEVMWLKVASIAPDGQLGRFSLETNPVPPSNAFLPLGALQEKAGRPGRANILLVAGQERAALAPEAADAVLREVWQPVAAGDSTWRADADLALDWPVKGVLELHSGRIFLEQAVVEAVRGPGAMGILAYLVNEIRLGERSVPYSFVAAMGPLDPGGAGGPPSPVPPDMKDDEILINAWLKEKLDAKPGDSLQMTYYVVGPGRTVRTAGPVRFRVRAVIPTEPPEADRTLMPRFPGLADKENCRDWEQQDLIDTKKILPKDEDYWDDHRGTPKALVTLAAGRQMWANRFGDLTAIRWAASPAAEQALADRIRERLEPSAVGLFFRPVRAEALAASDQALDFGQLFLSLSMFLLVAALILMGLLFSLGVEQRSEEVGTLLALGFPPRRVRRLLLAEGAVLAAVGALVGLGLGVWYTRAVLVALSTVWSGAVGGTPSLTYHAEPRTLAVGVAAGMLVALGSIWLGVRRQARRPARALLAGDVEDAHAPSAPGGGGRRVGLWVSLAVAAGALVMVGIVVAARGEGQVAFFFAAGAVLLVAGLGLARSLLAAIERSSAAARLTLGGLGWRNAARRRGRSLATVALVACGSFLVIAVGANRRDPLADAADRRSGTGGFALYAEASLPIYRDLADPKAQEAVGLDAAAMEGVAVVPLRVHEADDASCLNLNRVTRPRLVGVRPAAMESRFTFAKTVEGAPAGDPWRLLERRAGPVVESISHYRAGDEAVPAVGDAATITWSLGKKVGDVLPYTDERGRTFSIRLVGSLAGSMLQGGLLVSEEAFIEKFPSESGYRMFLVDAPAERSKEVARALARALAATGLAVQPAPERLADFLEVENTYLAIFQALGGLGLLLGTAGLGMVVMRNVLERRGELALLRAVGFSRGAIERLIVWEHWGLLALGLGCGVAAALVAVAPALASPGAPVPGGSLALVVLGVAASGLVWTYLAARWALGGPLLAALRNE